MSKQLFTPDFVYPPGETLLELLEDHEMTQAELAVRLERPTQTIQALIKGNHPVTADIALQLEAIFKMPAQLWLNLERDYRDYVENIVLDIPLRVDDVIGVLYQSEQKSISLEDMDNGIVEAVTERWKRSLAQDKQSDDEIFVR